MPEEGFCVFVQPVPSYFAFMCILRRVSEEVQFVGGFFSVYPLGIERSSRGEGNSAGFVVCLLVPEREELSSVSGILLEECQRKALCLGIICPMINSERGARGSLSV